jgi:hypothetical protein
MKFRPYLLLVSIALVLSACNPGFYYKPDPLTTDPKNTFISEGITTAISQTPFTRVFVSAVKPANNQLKLIIDYKNDGLERVDANPDSIKVIVKYEGKSYYLHVYSANEYLKKLQRQQNFALLMQGVAAGYNNAQAGYSRSTTTTTTTSPNGYYHVNTSTTTTYDANKVIAANLQSSQEIQQTANNYANYNQSISNELIRANTLFRGESVSGYVMVNTSKSFDEKIIIEVPFGNDIHKFTLVPNK